MPDTTSSSAVAGPEVTISVDLASVVRKAENGFFSNLPEAEATESAARYLKFLTLIKRYPHTSLAPTHDIDEMWHAHMLRPVAYYRDCIANFGEIIDHDGGFGAEEHEVPVLAATFQHTAELWEKEFGEPYTANDARGVKCKRDCVNRCWHACKSK